MNISLENLGSIISLLLIIYTTWWKLSSSIKKSIYERISLLETNLQSELTAIKKELTKTKTELRQEIKMLSTQQKQQEVDLAVLKYQDKLR